MRGMYTCGIMDVLLENGVRFDGAAGISAGATFGCNYKSKQPGRVLRYSLKYSGYWRYAGLRSWFVTGDLYNAKFCYHDITEILDEFDWETYKANPMEFYVGAFDVEEGKVYYHKCIDEKDTFIWIRASASLPLVAKVVETDGHKLLDGGIVDPVPYDFMAEQGYNRNVVILTQPREFRKQPDKTLPLLRTFLSRYPKVIAGVERRHDRYNQLIEHIRKKEEEGEALIICPDESLSIGRTESDPAQLQRVYDIGREAGVKALPLVRKFLES